MNASPDQDVLLADGRVRAWHEGCFSAEWVGGEVDPE
jgi:hypothetical protein